MKVLVVGGGGREHALIRKIKESKKVDSIACTPGNGGISYDADCYDVSATDIDLRLISLSFNICRTFSSLPDLFSKNTDT